jgi:hypothetical protein
MNWLKKGPELKLPKLKRPTLGGSGPKAPDIKPPAFLADFYYDLRDRRLLPVIALVIVAIVAVPFLLGSDSEEFVPTTEGTGAAEAGTAQSSSLAVVEATPGLRDYRKRLRGRAPSDPFVQQYTESDSGGEGSTAESSAAGGDEPVTTESSPAPAETESSGSPRSGGGSSGGGSSPGSGKEGGAPPAPSSGMNLIEFVFDVQISHSEATADGGQKMSAPEVRHRVKALTQLPGKKIPVVTVAGLNLHNGNVWFLVSDDVESLDGDFTCVTRAPGSVCELLEIKPGFPLELTYGPDRALYRIKVTGIDTIQAGKVGDSSRSSRAAFGFSGNSPRAAP